MRAVSACFAALALLVSCGNAGALTASQGLLVYNADCDASIAAAARYGALRGFPAANRLAVHWRGGFSCTAAEAAALDTQIRAKLKAGRLDFAVLFRDLPGTIAGSAGSLDSRIASDGKGSRMNPYRSRASVPFTYAAFGCYLVARIDGWSWEDVDALIARGSAAPAAGTFLLDRSPLKEAGGYASYGARLSAAAVALRAAGQTVTEENTAAFVGGRGLAGYASWGSNDPRFSGAVWGSITFAPGGIACTAVSTSAMYLRAEPSRGQSQIAALIRQGATGAEGAVAEPMLSGCADPIALAYYARGGTLGESFLAAQMYIGWQNVIVGDPLCAPYKKGL